MLLLACVRLENFKLKNIYTMHQSFICQITWVPKPLNKINPPKITHVWVEAPKISEVMWREWGAMIF